MTEFYHISRLDISNINSFSLEKYEGYIEAEGFFSRHEFHQYKNEFYPDGISKHGETYLHNVLSVKENDFTYASNELLIEAVFEIVRQNKFPSRKSRFVCSFGCLSLEDAKTIRKNTFSNQGAIYKVACENYFVADMNFLRQFGSIIGLQVAAEKYWSGQSSQSPFWEVLMECPVQILSRIDS